MTGSLSLRKQAVCFLLKPMKKVVEGSLDNFISIVSQQKPTVNCYLTPGLSLSHT